VPYERLAVINDRKSFMDVLKNITYSLGGAVPEEPSKPRVKRPRRPPGSRITP
jgi:hypothetical protein